MNGRRMVRHGVKALHELAGIGFGGGLVGCLVLNHVATGATSAEFIALRHAYAAVANLVLIPSLAIVVISGFVAMLATRGYRDAGWAWVKALLGLSVFEATLVIVGSGSKQAELLAATADPAMLAGLLRAERNTLWLLVAVGVANVALAVWRPRLTVTVR